MFQRLERTRSRVLERFVNNFYTLLHIGDSSSARARARLHGSSTVADHADEIDE
jgi:hypothetical protein